MFFVVVVFGHSMLPYYIWHVFIIQCLFIYSHSYVMSKNIVLLMVKWQNMGLPYYMPELHG